MKQLIEINELLTSFKDQYGIDAVNAQQNSGEWQQVKLGVISASNASKVVAKKSTMTRMTYMAELVAQVCTGIFGEINSKYLDWGHDNEAAARSCYEFQSGRTVTQLPFVFKDETFREGCSPDGIVDKDRGVEIKCPFTTVNYIKFLTEGKLLPEYVWQYQYTMRVMDAEKWDFTQYDPRMKRTMIHTVTLERDEEKQKVFEDAVPAFIEDMDAMLDKVGIKFGEQWG